MRRENVIPALVRLLAIGAGLSGFVLRAASDLAPLRSAAPRGEGPLALHNLTHVPLGAARVFGGEQPDLFLTGYGGARRAYVCRWLRNAGDGAPVFAEPQVVKSPYSQRGAVHQTTDGTVHGVWIDGRSLVHTTFDRGAMEFREVSRVALAAMPSTPASLALLPESDGSVTVVFDLAEEPTTKAGDPWTAEWRPWDAAGAWTGPWPYRYLVSARLPGLLRGPMTAVKQASVTKREVYFAIHQLTTVNLGPGRERDVIAGSRQGVLTYYRNAAERGVEFAPRQLVAGGDGNTLRNPCINSGVVAYAPRRGGTSDLIAGGEGALSYYAFTGRFTADGRPVYQAPVAVRQENAELYAGTLPVPTVVDWDGDGVQDIVAGNSEGRVLFLRNVGSDAVPAFLPGEPIAAGGRELHVEAGYSGSVQGVQESRWGYLSPNACDWNGDGLPDLVLGDITGNYTVCLNRGTRERPRLDAPQPLFCDGFPLHGMWRVRPAVGRMGGRTALVTVDDADRFHLYWRIDDTHVEDGGPLTLDTGVPITASGGPGGLTGRCKLDLFDWDRDGRLDFVVGTCRTNAIPNRTTGYPTPTLGDPRPPATVLFLRNVGTETRPVFAHAVPFVHVTKGPVQMGGLHESGAVGTTLGGGGPNLLATNEVGRFFLLRGENLTTRHVTRAGNRK